MTNTTWRRWSMGLAMWIGLLTASLAQTPIRLSLIEGLSGPFALTGGSVTHNLQAVIQQINAEGGVRWAGQRRLLVLDRYDSLGKADQALLHLQQVAQSDSRIVLQGNSSAVALALVDAIEKHNLREPNRQLIFLNYSAVEPSLTEERCSFWHFRFDAHANMRMQALMSMLKQDTSVKKVYLMGQNYSFGQAVVREAKRQLALVRPDIEIVGEELHAMAAIRDFLPYATKIRLSKADAVITGNWGDDLSLLVRASQEVGYGGKFYTFYGHSLGAPAAMGAAGEGRVIAVAEWFPNRPQNADNPYYRAFKQTLRDPREDTLYMRMHLMMRLLVKSLEEVGTQARSADISAKDLALALEKAQGRLADHEGYMRATDHQFQQPLEVGLMEKAPSTTLKWDVEGSGWGFRVMKRFSPAEAALPTRCQMTRP
ncbi:MAG: hypothetical protein RLZZ397_99 [Pseudomonadota bacterium]